MNHDIEIPEFWPLTHQWLDRRLLNVDHHQFARNVEIPASVAEHQKRKAEIVERVRFAVGLDILPPLLRQSSPCIPERSLSRRSPSGGGDRNLSRSAAYRDPLSSRKNRRQTSRVDLSSRPLDRWAGPPQLAGRRCYALF